MSQVLCLPLSLKNSWPLSLKNSFSTIPSLLPCSFPIICILVHTILQSGYFLPTYFPVYESSLQLDPSGCSTHRIELFISVCLIFSSPLSLFFREKGHVHAWAVREGQMEKGRILKQAPTLCWARHSLHPPTLSSWPELKARFGLLADWATQAPWLCVIFCRQRWWKSLSCCPCVEHFNHCIFWSISHDPCMQVTLSSVSICCVVFF